LLPASTFAVEQSTAAAAACGRVTAGTMQSATSNGTAMSAATLLVRLLFRLLPPVIRKTPLNAVCEHTEASATTGVA
jgi:hypothetical protein